MFSRHFGQGGARRGRVVTGVLCALGASFAAACSDGGGDPDGSSGAPECLEEPADVSCTSASYGVDPLTGEIAPTFHDVFTGTLQGKCGNTTACHSGAEAKRGLAFDDEDAAYDMLLADGTRGIPRVSPGDVQCGEVIVRIESPGTTYGMPPGRPLSEPELCAIRHWIENGAPR